jgi:hypothetical protein
MFYCIFIAVRFELSNLKLGYMVCSSFMQLTSVGFCYTMNLADFEDASFVPHSVCLSLPEFRRKTACNFVFFFVISYLLVYYKRISFHALLVHDFFKVQIRNLHS